MRLICCFGAGLSQPGAGIGRYKTRLKSATTAYIYDPVTAFRVLQLLVRQPRHVFRLQ
ncbi:MAG UNVERIFIED_CONTAM: hypothetical protein LVR18_14295 [Planctomycetaceae bacterium]